MGSALPPLLKLLLAVRRLLLRIFSPKFLRGTLTNLIRRSVFWAAFLRSKLCRQTAVDKPPKGYFGTSKEEIKTERQDAPYTIVKNGDIVSLNGAAFSLYPFSSNGIRNTSRSSVRLGQPQSRNASRSSRGAESNYSHSNAGSRLSVYELELHPTHRPPSRQFRNPRRQFSTSAPDLIDTERISHRANHNTQWYPQSHSPPPDVEIELASPVENQSPQTELGNRGPYIHSRPFRHPTTIREQTRDTSTSPPPDIEVETTSPIEVTSPANFSDTSLQVPSSTRSSPSSFRQTDSNRNSLNADVIHLGPISSRDSQYIHTIQPVLPEQTKRYTRRTKIRKKFTGYNIEPLTTIFESPSTTPGWIRFVHPEGARYFHHPEKKIYTDSDLDDPAIFARLMDDVLRLDRLAKTFEKPLPTNRALMIDVSYRDEANKDEFDTVYYFADHTDRAIFFLHPYDTYDMETSWEIEGAKSYYHLGFEIKAQYWHFVSLYPDSLEVTNAIVCELRDIVLWFIGDTMTSPFSTSPYTMEVLFQILSLTDAMANNVGPKHVGTMGLLARHMFIFYHSKFMDFHGETFARVERDFSVFGTPLNKRTWLVKILSVGLFSAPDVHLRNLQKMWVDGIMHQSVWEQTMKKMNDEWQEFIFFATVMLTSNVGFLAIQSVDTDSPDRSPAQIASYLSVVANTASIILGLLLMRQNRTKSRETADDVQKFLRERNHPMLGLETLAILYSLPYAFLMWGVVAFLVAFCCIFFQQTTAPTRGFVGSLCIAVAVLIAWCIATSWETPSDHAAEERPLAKADPRAIANEEDTESQAIEPPSKHTLLDIIRNIPNLMYGRPSVDSDDTAV